MFLLCFLINCIKLIKETAVSACVFGYHRKKQVRNLCLRDAVLTGGLLVIGTFIETEFLHENAIVLILIINGVAYLEAAIYTRIHKGICVVLYDRRGRGFNSICMHCTFSKCKCQ